jgi:pyruvyl transferase EpsI
VPSARLRSAQKIYSEAKALTLMLREKESYDFCKKYHPTTDIELMPDIALSITDAPTTQNRDGVLLCFRDDKERVLSEADRTAVISALRQINNDIETKEISTHIHRRVTKRTRKKELFALWNQFAASKLVITDRLHGMIFAAITGTPCIALNNLSKKVEGVYRLVHEEIPYISFMENTDHAKAMISAALAQPSTKYEYKYPIDRLYAIFSGTNIGTHPSTTHGGTING